MELEKRIEQLEAKMKQMELELTELRHARRGADQPVQGPAPGVTPPHAGAPGHAGHPPQAHPPYGQPRVPNQAVPPQGMPGHQAPPGQGMYGPPAPGQGGRVTGPDRRACRDILLQASRAKVIRARFRRNSPGCRGPASLIRRG
ncbi:hypothetical protein VQ056_15750 [Paenibacillus sp. JTLBN-2024]